MEEILLNEIVAIDREVKLSILFGDTKMQTGLLIISTELALYITHQLTLVEWKWSRK